MHSHLLPGIDDGVQSLEDAEAIILYFKKLGYTKLITTPHVMSDSYPNTPEIIHEKLRTLQAHLQQKNIVITIQAAAEYYLDEAFTAMVESDKPLLTFGSKHLLFETNFLTEPFNMKEVLFQIMTKGYKPILAHPERYLYLQDNLKKAEDLIDRGVLFQINISSITGYYSPAVQRTARQLIDRGWVHLLGSDCHHMQHARLIEEAFKQKHFQKAVTLSLLNNTL